MADAPSLDALHITPNLTCNDLQKSIHFYTEGLGFSVGDRHEHEGRLVYVILKGGNAMLGLGQDDFAKGKDRKKGVGQRFWIAVPSADLDGLAARVKAAGYTLASEPEELDWGGRAFNVIDPDGFAISVACD